MKSKERRLNIADKVSGFIKWWKSLEFPEDDYSPNSEYGIYKGQREERHWCPFCGYSGTADNIRCHLLNDHRGSR